MRRRDQPIDPVVRRRFDRMWPPDDMTSGGVASDEVASGGVASGGAEPAGPAAMGQTPTAAAVALAAFHPGRRAIKPLAILAAAIVLVAGYLAWRSQPRTELVAPAAQRSSTTVVTVASGLVASSPSAVELVVAIAGRVRHPGLVRLAPGARVADAIQAAGGALPGTDLSFVNLARKVADGELIVIGLAPPPGVTDGGGTPATAAGGIVDLNTATVADLDTLPGIGPAIAQRIVDYRTQHGGFRSIDELRNVAGIGDAKFAEIKDRVTV